MQVRRFVAATSRDAMRLLKAELGENALILANRRCAQGIEILATLDTDVKSLEIPREPIKATKVAARVGPMSTISFQDYVRDRLKQAQPDPMPESIPEPMPESKPESKPNLIPDAEPVVWRSGTQRNDTQLFNELQELKALISGSLRPPAGAEPLIGLAASCSRRLLDLGFSPALTRHLVKNLPSDLQANDLDRWLDLTIEKNCKTSSIVSTVIAKGGVCALIGPTGVGKTTTIAKLASRAVLQHGARAVSVITLDNFRVGAFEQLNAYAKILGIRVLQARDKETLQGCLSQLNDQKVIFVDTVGVSKSDDRLRALLQALEIPNLHKVFVAHAATQGDALESALSAYRVNKGDPIIVTKIDEVERLGGMMDCLIRHGLCLAGSTNGQRVPQDWRGPDSLYLTRLALKPRAQDAWHFDDELMVNHFSSAINSLGNKLVEDRHV
jgi:flagellar biosynthesis protein FlhF